MKIYDFDWSHLGNIEKGRPNLGIQAPVLIYRLMQYTFKDIVSRELGLEETEELFARAGELAGREFCRNVLDTSLPIEEFISDLEKKLIELKIGVLRVESSNMETLNFTVTVAEDLDCSGLPLLGNTVCDYDEGFLAGVFNEFSGKDFCVKETDCWAIGGRTCRFEIKPSRV